MGMKHSGVRNPNPLEFDDDFNFFLRCITNQYLFLISLEVMVWISGMKAFIGLMPLLETLCLEISRWNNNNSLYSKSRLSFSLQL